jgi:hypothetical protein
MMGQLERRGGDIREFSSQEVANMLWACGTKRGKPGERLIGQLERWVEPISGELNSQNIAITLWAFATMKTKPGQRLMGQLELQTDGYQGNITRRKLQTRCGHMRQWVHSRGSG